MSDKSCPWHSHRTLGCSMCDLANSKKAQEIAPRFKFRKKHMLGETRYELDDGNGRMAVLSLYPASNRKDFAKTVREAKAMIKQKVGYFR